MSISELWFNKEFLGRSCNNCSLQYLIDLSLASALEFKIPEEMWRGITPSYSHLKPFGWMAYVYIKQDKLEPRALKCVRLGYPTGVKRDISFGVMRRVNKGV